MVSRLGLHLHAMGHSDPEMMDRALSWFELTSAGQNLHGWQEAWSAMWDVIRLACRGRISTTFLHFRHLVFRGILVSVSEFPRTTLTASVWVLRCATTIDTSKLLLSRAAMNPQWMRC